MIKFLISLFIITLLSQTLLFAKEINIDKAITSASKSNKKVLIYLHRTGCSYCNSMSEFTLDDDSVKKFIAKNYIFISVNITDDDKITYQNFVTNGLEFAKRTGYNFYPSTLFLNTIGKIEYAAVGYKDEFDFAVILKYVKNGYNKNMDLQTYKKSIGFKKNSTTEIKDERIYTK